MALYKGSNGNGQATAIAASPDGSKVFVTGSSATTAGGFAYATVAYDAATGARLWVARYTGSAAAGVSSASSVAVSPDGSTVFVTGTAGSGPGVRGWATVAYAAATGARLWRARYSGPVNKGGFARSVAVSPDGSEVFVTGSAVKVFRNLGQYQSATVAYDAATGSRRWLRLYPDRARYSPGVGIAVSADGSKVFVTGTTAEPGVHYATVAYSS